MTPRWTGFQSPLAAGIQQHIAFKRAFGRASPPRSERSVCLTASWSSAGSRASRRSRQRFSLPSWRLGRAQGRAATTTC
jgi:hypothetical protein